MKKRLLIIAVFLACGTSPAWTADSPLPMQEARRAMWVWTTPDNQALVDFAKANNVREIFYSISPRIGGAELARLQALKPLTDAAHITLDALGGDPTWATTATADAIAWEGQAMRTGLFAGVHFDIEPNQFPDWEGNKPAYAAAYIGAIKQIKAANPAVHVEVDMQFAWCTIPVSGYASMADGAIANADATTLMSYRNTATGNNSMFAIAQDGLAKAQAAHKPMRLGAETNDAQPRHITFYGMGRAAMQAVLARVDAATASYPSYGGIAIEDYDGWSKLAP